MLFFLRPFVVVLSAFGLFKDFFVVVVTSFVILLLLLFLSSFYCCYFQTNSNWSHSLQLSTTPSDLIYDYVATLTPHYLTLTFSTLLYPVRSQSGRLNYAFCSNYWTLVVLSIALSTAAPLRSIIGQYLPVRMRTRYLDFKLDFKDTHKRRRSM